MAGAFRRISHARRSVLGLARVSAASRHHAEQRRDPHGHRGGLFAAFEIQGVLDVDLRAAGLANFRHCRAARARTRQSIDETLS